MQVNFCKCQSTRCDNRACATREYGLVEPAFSQCLPASESESAHPTSYQCNSELAHRQGKVTISNLVVKSKTEFIRRLGQFWSEPPAQPHSHTRKAEGERISDQCGCCDMEAANSKQAANSHPHRCKSEAVNNEPHNSSTEVYRNHRVVSKGQRQGRGFPSRASHTPQEACIHQDNEHDRAHQPSVPGPPVIGAKALQNCHPHDVCHGRCRSNQSKQGPSGDLSCEVPPISTPPAPITHAA